MNLITEWREKYQFFSLHISPKRRQVREVFFEFHNLRIIPKSENSRGFPLIYIGLPFLGAAVFSPSIGRSPLSSSLSRHMDQKIVKGSYE